MHDMTAITYQRGHDLIQRALSWQTTHALPANQPLLRSIGNFKVMRNLTLVGVYTGLNDLAAIGCLHEAQQYTGKYDWFDRAYRDVTAR